MRIFLLSLFCFVLNSCAINNTNGTLIVESYSSRANNMCEYLVVQSGFDVDILFVDTCGKFKIGDKIAFRK